MENELGMQFCRIKGGVFHMGASPGDPDADTDEKPAHNVVLTDFYMGIFPVTRGQFAEFVRSSGYLGSCRYGSIELLQSITEHGKETNSLFRYDPSFRDILRNIENWLGIQREKHELGLNYSSFDKELREEVIYFRDLHKDQRENPSAPVIQVSYQDADEFCKWLTSNFPGRYMLPTEAQWEYCCRSGTTTRFSWGDEPEEEYANFGRKKMLTNQGAYPVNVWGLFDMHGNVWELCQDIYCPDYYKDLPDMSMDPLHTSVDYKMIDIISRAMDIKNLSSMQRAVIAASGDSIYEYTTAMATRRVVRGGSCASSGTECRSSQRETADNVTPVGFRCAWIPDKIS